MLSCASFNAVRCGVIKYGMSESAPCLAGLLVATASVHSLHHRCLAPQWPALTAAIFVIASFSDCLCPTVFSTVGVVKPAGFGK
mmetsp:Transcript_36741/g.78021  ORF Transcript_36741/g.78021 Transcript_36741/m.78021 type:complete len:84 (+) Transcript_36741:165-416(+)